MLVSLELLPMWAGVEPDVALFASGRALDEGGEWSGGHALSAAAGTALPARTLTYMSAFFGGKDDVAQLVLRAFLAPDLLLASLVLHAGSCRVLRIYCLR